MACRPAGPSWWRALPIALVGGLAGCEESRTPDDAVDAIRAPAIARVVPAAEALANAHVPTLDPATMTAAEIGLVLGTAPRCTFRYTTSGAPVVAFVVQPGTAGRDGVVKLNGHLVPLAAQGTDAGNGPQRIVLGAGVVRLAIGPEPPERIVGRTDVRQREASAIFEVEKALRVGYRGYLHCGDAPRR